MFSDQKIANIQPNKSKQSRLSSYFSGFSGSLVAGLFFFSIIVNAGPASATKLPGEFSAALKSSFPEGRVRLDGSFETSDGQLFLPVLPKTPSNVKLIHLRESLPAVASSGAKSPRDFFFFDNGYVYIRVVKKLNIKTFPSVKGLPEAKRNEILAGHLPHDLIVPEGFSVPTSLKQIVGDVDVPLLQELSSLPQAPVKLSKIDAALASTKGGLPKESHQGAGHGYIFVTSPSTGTISMVAEDSMKKVAEVPTEGTPGGMALAGDHLYIADQSKNRIMVLDFKERSFLGAIELPPRACPKSVVALPNGKLLYVSESGLGQVACVEVETSRVLLTSKVPPGPSRMALTPDGSTLLILNVPTGQLTFLSTANQRVIATIAVGANPTSVVVAPDGQTGYVSCRSNGYVAIIDIPARKMLGGIKAGNAPTGLAITPDGKKLYVACAKDNKIIIFDTLTRAQIKELTLPSDVDFPGTLCLLPGGDKLVVSSASTEKIAIYDADRGEFDEQLVIGHGTDETYFVPVN